MKKLRIAAAAGMLTFAPALCFATTVTVTNDLPSIGITDLIAKTDVGGSPAVVSKALGAKAVITSETATNGVPTMASGVMLPTTNFSEQVLAKSTSGGKTMVIVKYAIQYATSSTASAGGQSIDLPSSQTYQSEDQELMPPGSQKTVTIAVPSGPKLTMIISVSK